MFKPYPTRYSEKSVWVGLLFTLYLLIFLPASAEAGLISGLLKLGKKVDTPNTHLSAFHFADELAKYPHAHVAELNFNHSQQQWLAKTADGKTVTIEQFTAASAATDKQAILLLSERNLPPSLEAFNTLPSSVQLKIKPRKGPSLALIPAAKSAQLIDRNIAIDVSSIADLKTALWQLQRPITSPNMRLIQLADNPKLSLPQQDYGSKITVEKVSSQQLLDAISNMRQQTLVISANVDSGFLTYGKQKVAISDIESAASKRDVSLIILDSNQPKQTLQQLAKDWQKQKDSGALLSLSTGDFYNTFAQQNALYPNLIDIHASGQARTAIQFSHKTSEPVITSQNSHNDLLLLPLKVLTHSVTLFRPDEARSEELDKRFHPLIPSWVHLFLIGSILIGVFALKTSWDLYLKLWASPYRADSKNVYTFTLSYILHRFCFLLLYLPLLGFISPIYLLIKWSYQLLNLLLIRPLRWIMGKLA